MNQPAGIPTQGPQTQGHKATETSAANTRAATQPWRLTYRLLRQLLWQTLMLAVLIAPASAAYVGGNSLQGKMFLDASSRQVAADLSATLHPGSDEVGLRWTAECFVAPNNTVRRTAQTLDPEIAAQEALTRLQGNIQGGHFLTRHSPLVSRNVSWYADQVESFWSILRESSPVTSLLSLIQ